MSLGGDLIASMGGVPVRVRRSRGGEYVKGEWVEAGALELLITASVQPMSGREIERLPEGDRMREGRKAYFAGPVFAGSEITGAQADTVLIEGRRFQVYNVEQWPQYWKALLLLEPRKED